MPVKISRDRSVSNPLMKLVEEGNLKDLRQALGKEFPELQDKDVKALIIYFELKGVYEKGNFL